MAGVSLALAGSLALARELGARPGKMAIAIGVLVGVTGFLGSVTQLARDRFAEVATWKRVAFSAGIGCVFVVTVFVLLRYQAPPPPLYRLTGPQDVAVVGFKDQGSGQDRRILNDVSASFTHDLGKNLPAGTAARDYAKEFALPLTELLHHDHPHLDARTRTFVDQSNAAIAVGGIVQGGPAGQVSVRPAVYVRPDHVTDAPEIAGWYTGSPINTVDGLASAHSRAALVADLVTQARRLAQFTDALDAWQAGESAQAERTLARLLPGGRKASALDSGSGFVSPDLVHLFRGHALEQAALNGQAVANSALEAARAEYQAIPADSPIRLRAQLSLAGNTYERALGPEASCAPGTVRAADMAAASSTLRRLAADTTFTRIGRLKATVNLAQVEYCRLTAGLTSDAGTVDRAVRRVREAPPGVGVRGLQAIAISIAAQREYGRGKVAAAISEIRQALALEAHFTTRAQWQTFLAYWSLDRCDLATGAQAARDSLRELHNAVLAGTATQKAYEASRQYLDQLLSDARASCGSRSPS
ncbi:hypothetical protein [Streptomyces turgidiscabies]|uniref:Uncharacterized protein n=1 Tax=Streptomyces turgidiscabies TaxID=85558 RepID=A0ABU0RZR8_9ACTN|nr:hypothetical protein [Streptomyces turgidiscabies]MDQ0937308.1 hypothetical protein [Streptomyces turgidiscabies]